MVLSFLQAVACSTSDAESQQGVFEGGKKSAAGKVTNTY